MFIADSFHILVMIRNLILESADSSRVFHYHSTHVGTKAVSVILGVFKKSSTRMDTVQS